MSNSSSSENSETVLEDEQTISILSWYNEEILGPYIESFEEENKNITVDLQFVPPVQQYIDKFMVLVSSEQMTDMFHVAGENIQEIREKKLAEDISDMPIFERINENVSAVYGGDNGEIYGYVPDAWVGGVFYNADLFEQAGIEKVPSTWDEFTDTMEKTKALGVEPFITCSDNVHEMAQSLYISMKISHNPKVDFEINNGTTTFEENYTEPFKLWYEDVYKTGLFSQITLGLSGEQAKDMFVTEQSAMYYGGPWDISYIEEKNPDMNYNMFPLPAPDGNAMLTGALNVALGISSSSKKKEAAQKFLDFMSEDENIKAWQKSTNNVLVVDGIEYEMGTIIDQFKDDAPNGNFYLPQMVWNNSAAIYKELLTGIQDAMTGADTIENVPIRLDNKMKELS